ncbi:hypothetical protein DPMN_010696 [Dreissena polymorpha]|uniref:Uncharacterized protein n=1 Tax=Dreissena polymorpha TaxID=45954 RepID=A0A9D4MZ73_DREPO|nr:hypothetical protein DPMN_010696 [Dreissena polymorpha]
MFFKRPDTFSYTSKISLPKTNLLTKKNAPPPGGYVFQPTGIFFKLVQDIIGTILVTKFYEDQTINEKCNALWTNLLAKFYDDRTTNVASRVKNAPPLGGYVFQPTQTIFKLIQDIIKMNLLTKFHEDQTINVVYRVLTRKNAQPPDIIGTNLLTKFHDDRTIIICYSYIRKNAPPPWKPYIIGTNLLTKFHEDRTINVASREISPNPWWPYIIGTILQTKKNAPPPGVHVFQPTNIIFELVKDIIGMNLLIKFHEDGSINVASRVLTRKNSQPLCSHVFQPTGTIFELIQDIIKTNLLTKFHEDLTINVASRELTRQILTLNDTRWIKGDHKSSP